MNGDHIAVIDSYVSDFKEVGADSQALWCYNGRGPFKIHHNYLEAAGENVMFGGKDTDIANLVTADITITRNHFFKPLSWVPLTWSVKNILEFKNGQRALVEGNILENCWAAGQNGTGILLTPRNQNGGSPNNIVQDITIRLNKILNVESGLSILGKDNEAGPTLITNRVLIENNLFLIENIASGDHRVFLLINSATLSGEGPNNLTVRHNTGLLINITGGGAGSSTFSEMNGLKADQFDYRDNLLSTGTDQLGFVGTGTTQGTPTLVAYYTNYTLTANAFIGGLGTYPAGNFFPANNAAVGFVDFAVGNYRLTSGSAYHNAASDGLDIGADIDAIEAAIAGEGGEPPVAPPVGFVLDDSGYSLTEPQSNPTTISVW